MLNKIDCFPVPSPAGGLEMHPEWKHLDQRTAHIACARADVIWRRTMPPIRFSQGQPGAALYAYEASLKAAPERLRGYYGATKAAAASGDKAKAIAYYRKLDQLTKSTRSDRPELKEMKLFLAAK